MKKISGIYCFYNKEEDAYYIGQSKNIEIRYQKHLTQLRQNIHKNYKLQKAWIKYGEEAFEFKILMEAPEDALNHLEDYYIKKFNSISKGYNIQSGSMKYKSVEKTDAIFLFEVEEDFNQFSIFVIKKLLKDKVGEIINLVSLMDLINIVYKINVEIELLIEMLNQLNIPIYAEISLEDACFDYDLSYRDEQFGQYEKQLTEDDLVDFIKEPSRLYIKDKKICLDSSAKKTIDEHNKNIEEQIIRIEEDTQKYRYEYGKLAIFMLDHLDTMNLKKIEEVRKEKVTIDKKIDLLENQKNDLIKKQIRLIID